MKYRYELARPADRYVRRLERRAQEQIVNRFRALCENPFDPALSHELHGRFAGLRTSEVSGLRVIFGVDKDAGFLTIVAVGPRGDIYKRP